MESSDCCSICLENMVESETTLTPCSHRFHTTCLQRWNQNSCPNCRRRLSSETTQSIDQREMNTRELNTREISMREINIIQSLSMSYNYDYNNIINYNTLNDMINYYHNGRVVTVRYGPPDPIVHSDRT
jgi:hypothetical protein